MVTQKDIAKKLGISRTTVARAINGSSHIKKDTKEKILKLVESMDYQKNYVGSSLATKKKKIYVFIVESKNSFYTDQIKKGIKKIKQEYKYHNLELCEIITDINEPEEQLKELKRIVKTEEKIDGIIITPLNREKINSFLSPYFEKIKVVSMSIELNERIPHVGPDYFEEGKIAAGILSNIIRNNEKILVIDNGDDNISSKYYLKGFLSKSNEKEMKILGPYVRSGVDDSIRFLDEKLKKEEFSSIYINRYAQDILKSFPIERLKDKKIVTNGIGKRIKRLIKNNVIIATVTDDVYETSYTAGQIMFDILYKNGKIKLKKIVSEPKIIFLENLK